MKKRKFDETVHHSMKGRKRYKTKMWLIFVGLVLVLLACSAMFYFGNVTWNPDEGFEPAAHPEQPYQIALVVLASIISVGALVGTFVYCWFDINMFYKTQQEYQKSDLYKRNKAKALNGDVTKLSKKTLKWYKKIGYLTSDEIKKIKEEKAKKK